MTTPETRDSESPMPQPLTAAALQQLMRELRPRLHRHCARMTGSVIDGEDVVQEALLKALEALPRTGAIANPEAWLFRITHNAALDFLRRRARQQTVAAQEEVEMIAAPVNVIEERQVAAASLRTFMRLPAAQRGAVILRDVLGYSLEETAEIMAGSLPATKSALQRGRLRLQQIAGEPADAEPPRLTAAERSRLVDYVARFNARDFDGIRVMLADDVRLDLVNRLQAQGRAAVGRYFIRYSEANQWHFVAGFVDRRPAILVYDRHDLGGRPAYFVLLDWAPGGIATIRDFIYARYAVEGAELQALA